MKSRIKMSKKFSKTSIFSVAPLVCLFIVGCGTHNKDGDEFLNQSAIPMSVVELPGELEARVLAVADSNSAVACDQENRQQKLDLARALDRRTALLNHLSSTSSQTDAYTLTALGPIRVRRPVAEPDSSEYPWVHKFLSWNDILQSYERIKDDNENFGWVLLQRKVRNIIDLDEKRVLENKPMFDHDDQPFVLNLKDILNRCVANVDCNQIRVEPSSHIQHYSADLQNIATTMVSSQRRSLIETLAAKVEDDYNQQYFFQRHPSVVRQNSTEIFVTLDAGPFQAVQDQLTQIIQNAWSSPELSVKVNWASRRQRPGIFAFLALPAATGQSYVDRNNSTVLLSSDIEINNIAHEIGHVLGFRDNHFSPWVSSRCAYDVQTKNEDIMSDPSTGKVTRNHWIELERNYPRPYTR